MRSTMMPELLLVGCRAGEGRICRGGRKSCDSIDGGLRGEDKAANSKAGLTK